MDALILYFFVLINVFWMIFCFVLVSLLRQDKIEVTVKDTNNIKKAVSNADIRVPSGPPPASKNNLDNNNLQDVTKVPFNIVAKSVGAT